MPVRHRPSRAAGVVAVALVASLGPVTGAGTAPLSLAVTEAGSPGVSAPPGPPGAPAQPAEPARGFPRQTRLSEPAADPGDAALRPGLTAYDQIAPRLNDLQAASDRVSADVIGTSAGGRELYLVTLTAPETPGQARRQDLMRRRILTDPVRAAADPWLALHYKVPVLINANIHGDEYEGTDAVLRLVEDYATSTDPAVRETLEATRISLVVSMNPDGRHGNTRFNSAGFDLNRDFLTATQPETRAVRDAVIEVQPMLVLDLHGYVNGTLVEPTTPPHAENLELDLVLEHAHPTALAIEQAVLGLGHGEADGVRAPQVPFRDWAEGWDGWPPIFTPQYAALHGATGLTVEMPLRVNRSSYDLPAGELRRRSGINTDIALAAVTATLGYAVDRRSALVEAQVEWYRRGETGAAQVPVTDTDIPGAGPEDVYLTHYPRAYVIPVGPGQRSETAAARLVDHLIDNGVEVTATRRPVTVGGTSHPAGSYLVDMHQARRGVAGAILGPGTDISARVEATYDMSGWSHALLWGADVDAVPAGTAAVPTGPALTAAGAPGRLVGRGPWELPLVDPADAAALNHLLAAGVAVRWAGDGTVSVPAGAAATAADVVREHGVVLTAAGRSRGRVLDDVTVAASAPAPELWALREMGFEVVPVSPDVLSDGFDWSGIDTLYVSSGLAWADLDQGGRRDLTAYLSGGGGVVARGEDGLAFNEAVDLLEVTPVAGRDDANGVVRVDSPAGPVAGGATAETFVYAPHWFTGLGDGVSVDQRFASDDLVVSGHWRDDRDGRGGPDDAAGQPVVVRGLDRHGATRGAPVVLLGSEPLFRAHPKGQYALVARALLWSSVSR